MVHEWHSTRYVYIYFLDFVGKIEFAHRSSNPTYSVFLVWKICGETARSQQHSTLIKFRMESSNCQYHHSPLAYKTEMYQKYQSWLTGSIMSLPTDPRMAPIIRRQCHIWKIRRSCHYWTTSSCSFLGVYFNTSPVFGANNWRIRFSVQIDWPPVLRWDKNKQYHSTRMTMIH